eukprot:RCo040440
MYSVQFTLGLNRDHQSPSRRDGVSPEQEANLLCFAAEVMQEAALRCKLDSSVLTRASILLHRFYQRKSLKVYDVKGMVAPALVIAAKVEDVMPDGVGRNYQMLMRVVLTVVESVLQQKLRPEGELHSPLHYLDPEYGRQLQSLIDREREMLAALGFILHVEHPQRFLLTFAKLLQLEPEVTQCAWNFLLDSLRLPVHMFYTGNVVATACLYLAFRKLGQEMPKCSPPWYTLFDTTPEALVAVSRQILQLYHGEVRSEYSPIAPGP